ncbi:hypothetical protein DVA67_027385 [Solirubrobacter sp. CPCC 204708]|uniref:PKD/Chitinase domain-containing protein n=1 Tax=Solirubrobacter deserti TaxID=2282478 RepID=A0ABT4RG87_9ACTN|nr:hypothetical protein [Solirubrobacter deserti]MBE2319723.1 hypothetical protein [Solirubrobacter deserti]MDA0137537.1 hypothetical protein [Solirubrobacter deserti]
MVSRLVATGVFGAALLAPEVASACSVVPESVAISIGMSPASPRAGSEVELTGGAGADGYAWDLDGDGEFDDATGKRVTATFPAGERTVRAQAVTPLGLLTDSRTFTVHGWNGTPTGTVSATPYSARAGAPVKVTATGSDPDGRTVQTALDLDGDGTFETTGTTGTAMFATAGERVIRARFTDDAGATAVATTTLDVHAGNLAPTVDLDQALCGPGGWSLEALDPDGEIVRYEYDFDGDGTYETDRGRDARVPNVDLSGVRVTDDSGATATTRTSSRFPQDRSRVVEVGKPVTLKSSGRYDAQWDADGDGEFDDGTGEQITFTYLTPGTYEVRVRRNGAPAEPVTSVSARDAADIAVPRAHWMAVSPARPSAATLLQFAGSGPTGADWAADLDADGAFDDAPPNAYSVWRRFDGPATLALRATDARGRTAVSTTQVPFVPGNLGPDATMQTGDVANPLQAAYRRTAIGGGGSDADAGDRCCLGTAWDADGDGEYDDGPSFGWDDAGHLAASFGLRVTDDGDDSVTLRRSVTPVPVPRVEPPVLDGIPAPWLRVSARRPQLKTLLRRGVTVDVTCTKPKCRTRLTLTVDAKTARKLKLRSRTVASRTVTGTRRATLKLTPKARKALKGVRSVKLTLTAKASVPGQAGSTTTTTMTIRNRR